jgi:hypothetical protein
MTMSLFKSLFKRTQKPAPRVFMVAQLNARLQPMHRGEFFENALNAELERSQLGEITGGGTLQAKNGEIEYCDIEVEISGDASAAEATLVRTLEALGAPRGSKLHIEAEGREIPFGLNEGLAVYLNGTSLPDHVYKECDSNFVHSEFGRLLEGKGRVLSYWQGPTETAFYMYGPSFAAMEECLAQFLATYPLCQQCRLVQIA